MKYYVLADDWRTPIETNAQTWMDFVGMHGPAHRLHVGDTTCGQYRVSTMFFGYVLIAVRPLIWETKVFLNHVVIDERKYATREEAEAGHHAICLEYFGGTDWLGVSSGAGHRPRQDRPDQPPEPEPLLRRPRAINLGGPID